MAQQDESVLHDIDRLVKEEEQLYQKSELNDQDRTRLAELKIRLDQCWDLLRQRRALREFGKDPNAAEVRPADIVENYEQ
jgi:flagellar biosynthesis/type III secretory pathway chaperone